MTRSPKLVAAVVAGVLIAGGLFLLGRLTAPSAAPKSTPHVGDYFDGLRAGEAQGRQLGRALQDGVELPRGQRDVARHAFNAGYVAGANDVFAGYDGGWAMPVPWIITVAGGPGQIAYRIHDREQLPNRASTTTSARTATRCAGSHVADLLVGLTAEPARFASTPGSMAATVRSTPAETISDS